MGGFPGAVRRVTGRWQRPFTANQVKVAIVRRHPELIPGEFQIEDILAECVRNGKLERRTDGSFQHAKPAVKFVNAEVSRKNRQLKLIFGK